MMITAGHAPQPRIDAIYPLRTQEIQLRAALEQERIKAENAKKVEESFGKNESRRADEIRQSVSSANAETDRRVRAEAAEERQLADAHRARHEEEMGDVA